MGKIKHLTTGFRDWIVKTLQEGTKPEAIFEAMVQKGFDERFTFSVLFHLAKNQQADAETLNIVEHTYTYEEMDIKPIVETSSRTVKALSIIEKPVIVHYDNFLSEEECDELIRLAKDRLKPSTVVDPKTGEVKKSTGRTSSGMAFAFAENPLVETIEKRIEEVTRYPAENGEGLQVLHYQIGEEYKTHYDYFPPDQVDKKRGGQRCATMLLYLNDVEEGGETVFPRAGVSLVPKKGSAVYFHYCNSKGELDRLSLHRSVPVKRGEKWVATKWIRQGRIYS